jgi:DNA polymerase V
MMSLAAGLGPAQEIYSIDESFIDLTGVRGDLVERSRASAPHSSVGSVISAALALHPRKTLAKYEPCGEDRRAQARHLPDKLMQVCNFADMTKEAFDASAGGDAGQHEVGGASAQLNEGGVNTALDLAQLDTATI